MDDEFSVEVRTTSFEAGMQRLKTAVRQGLINPDYGTLTVQGRLLAERCQTLTPPRDKGQGQAAVARDLTRIFKPLSALTFTNPRIAKIVRTGDRAGWDAAAARFQDGHGLSNTHAIPFSEDWHRQNRISRGRVTRKNLGVVTIGGDAAKARAYIKTVKARVGWAKAGWNLGILSLGGRVGTAWVSRHSVNRGTFTDGRAQSDPSIRVGNDTGWGKYRSDEGNRIIQNAAASRARDMQTFVDHAMKRAVDTMGASAFSAQVAA